MKPLPLRTSLSLFYTGILAVILTALGLAHHSTLVRQLDVAETEGLEEKARALHGYIQFRNHTPVLAYNKDDLELDTIRRVVRRKGSRIELKPKEYALLEYLMRNSGRAVTKTLIIEHVWNIHFDSISNVVEVHINSLRHKIDREFSPPLIHTVRGVGYMLTDNPP